MMISPRSFLHIRKISALNSLRSTETYRMLEPIRHHSARSQFEFGSFRSFGKWFIPDDNNVVKNSRSEMERKAFAANDRYNRERATVGSMIYVINKVACDFLDLDFCFERHLARQFWDDEDSCLMYWFAVFDHSETALALKLKNELKNAGISYQDFCNTIVDVYFTLKNCDHYILVVKIEPEDVKNIIEQLEFNSIQYECLRILYCIHDTYGWKI